VLSADYLTVPTDEIGRIESVLTLLGGKVVYAAPPFSARANPRGR
jgi:predicted amidohydrolase YtcJ